MIQAAPLQRVVELAGAVGGDDDDRRHGGADRAELGNGHLKVGQQLEQKPLELLVGAIELVDEQHRRRPPVCSSACSSGRLIRNASLNSSAARACAIDDAGGLQQPDLEELARVVPLVHAPG